MENDNVFGEEQAGFRKKYSTVDHVFVLNALIDFYPAKHTRLYCGFIDFKKAFDTIDRAKLLSSGINGKWEFFFASHLICIKISNLVQFL
jgi:hypothetical protein